MSPEIRETATTERTQHRSLVLRHVDFLAELLAADQELEGWNSAAGCPHATPETIARTRKSSGVYPCIHSRVFRYEGTGVRSGTETSCGCGDPLAGSDDPLDTVASVVLAGERGSPSEYFLTHSWRGLVSALRDREGTWKEIARLTVSELESAIESAGGRRVARFRVARLHAVLGEIRDDDRVDGVSLADLPPRPYSSLVDMLSSLPGITNEAAWWLLPTAFDKPVWPANPQIDRLLTDLALLSPDGTGYSHRHTQLESDLTDRQIPALYRAIGGYAARGLKHLGSRESALRKFSLTYRFRRQVEHRNESRPVAVDLFAGAGGLSHGILEAGYDIGLAVDNDRSATDTYRLNHPQIPHRRVICSDIEELLDREEWPEIVDGTPEIMVGGPPCQSLSQAGYRARRADDSSYSIRDDPRTDLYTNYLRAVAALQPRALIVENVEGMANEIGDTDDRVVDQVIADLESLDDTGGQGYRADFTNVDCSRFGIPQKRNRIIIAGIREDLLQEDIRPEDVFDAFERRARDDERYTLRQGLSGLPRIRCDEGANIVIGGIRGTRSRYVRENGLADGTRLSFNHRAREHPMEKDRKLFDVMDPGDTGWFIKYRKDDGRWSHLIEYNVGTEENPAFTDKYRMIHWDEPAPTVVAHFAKDTNNYVLPDYYEYVRPDPEREDPLRNRGVTPREAARLQSFPDDFIFLGPFTRQFRQIGNAVPPVVARELGATLQDLFLGPDIRATSPVDRVRPVSTVDD